MSKQQLKSWQELDNQVTAIFLLAFKNDDLSEETFDLYGSSSLRALLAGSANGTTLAVI